MNIYYYYLNSLYAKCDSSVYLSTEHITNNDVFEYEPKFFFNNDKRCDAYKLIGVGQICKEWNKSQLIYYPSTTFVVSKLRNKGIGKLLYKIIIHGIYLHSGLLKTKPILMQHGAYYNLINNNNKYTETSNDAKNVYKALEKKQYITKLNSAKYKSHNVYQINRMPNIALYYIYSKTISGYQHNIYYGYANI